MSLAVAIQMDPIEGIDIDADSSFALALEAQRRGHGLYLYLPQDLSLRDGRVYARAQSASASGLPATSPPASTSRGRVLSAKNGCGAFMTMAVGFPSRARS